VLNRVRVRAYVQLSIRCRKLSGEGVSNRCPRRAGDLRQGVVRGVLFYTRSDGEYVEVAKIDDSEHEEGAVHFDRYYRADGANRKDFDVEADSLFEAESLVRNNWRRYARLYEENHG